MHVNEQVWEVSKAPKFAFSFLLSEFGRRVGAVRFEGPEKVEGKRLEMMSPFIHQYIEGV